MDESDFLPNLNKTAERYLQRVQALVKYCPNCQPYDGGDYVWIWGKKTTLNDIFYDLNVPEKYREDISAHISCGTCGTSGFDQWDTVGTEDNYDILRKKHLRLSERKYGKQVNKLQEYLEKYPLLTMKAPLGRTIYKEITQRNPPTCSVQGTWYRTRPVTEAKTYQLEDMKAPPIGCAGDGRYNHAGQSILYLAEDLETSMREAVNDLEESTLVWTQKYQLEIISNILDLTNDWDNYDPSTSSAIVALLSSRILCRKVSDRESKWKPEYFITRYIADCARSAKFNGIKYDSTRGYGSNIVLFNHDSLPISAEGKPERKSYEPMIYSKPSYVMDF